MTLRHSTTARLPVLLALSALSLSACEKSAPSGPAASGPAIAGKVAEDVPKAEGTEAPERADANSAAVGEPSGAVPAAPPAAEPGETLAEASSDDRHREISVENPHFDWGVTFQGQTFEHTFKIVNSGEAPITIEEIRPECGCTVSDEKFNDFVLAAGAEISVPISVDTAEFTGYTKKDIDIICKEPVEGTTKLQLMGDVEQIFARDPEEARFDLVRDKEVVGKTEWTISFAVNLDKSITLDAVRAEKGHVEPRIVEAEKGVEYEVHLKPKIDLESKVALYNETLLLDAHVEKTEVALKVPVTIGIKSRIQVLPSRSLWFARKMTRKLLEEGAEPPEILLEIVSAGAAAHRFHITAVEADPVYETSLETVTDGRHYKLRVVLKRLPEYRNASAKVAKAAITLKTDDPSLPVIKIPGSVQR